MCIHPTPCWRTIDLLGDNLFLGIPKCDTLCLLDLELLSQKLHHIAGDQLMSPTGFHFAIDDNIACLDKYFRLAARGDQSGHLDEVVEADLQ